VPSFFTKEQCLQILKKLLGNNELLNGYYERFKSKVINSHEDKKSFEIISQAVNSQSNRKVKLIKIPYWYLRIAAKHIIIRNIKLSNIIKSMKQLIIIFSILKDIKLHVKLLIIFETIINILWYSIILTLRPKK